MTFVFSKILSAKSVVVYVFVPFLFSVFHANSQNGSRTLYRDTIIVHEDYVVTVTKTYAARFLFLKSTIRIYNPYSSYLILDHRSAYITGKNGSVRKLLHKENAVFFPGGNFVQRLKFKPIKRSKQITFHFPKVMVTDSVITNYPAFDIPRRRDVIKKVNNVKVEVIKIIPFEKEIKIRLRVYYYSPEFLAIDIPKISITGDQSGRIYGKANPRHRMYHRRIKDFEMFTITFPIQKGEKIQDVIHFEDVFKTYSLKRLEGFELSYTLYKDEDKIDMNKSATKKPAVTEDE